MLIELEEVSKSLQETVFAITIRKRMWIIWLRWCPLKRKPSKRKKLVCEWWSGFFPYLRKIMTKGGSSDSDNVCIMHRCVHVCMLVCMFVWNIVSSSLVLNLIYWCVEIIFTLHDLWYNISLLCVFWCASDQCSKKCYYVFTYMCFLWRFTLVRIIRVTL